LLCEQRFDDDFPLWDNPARQKPRTLTVRRFVFALMSERVNLITAFD
jgi:hypothetical protein